MPNQQSQMTHVVIPFASSLDETCQAAIKTLALPNLSRLLKQAELTNTDSGDEFDFIPPHERVLGSNEQIAKFAQVVVTPCHWSVGIDHIRMDDPSELQLNETESRALLAAVTPYFEGDGLTLTYDTPLRWLAQGEALSSMALQGIFFASLDRVIGRNVDVWQPQSDASKSIRRLQNEMQMLLYTHPINDAREARDLPAVNSFWLSHEANVDARFYFSLRASALRSDWHAWAEAWHALDKKLVRATQITLCGERHAVTYVINHSPTIRQRISRLISSQPSAYKALQNL